ncbi:cohesin domain-containing protein [Fibrobacterota bacterium]
MGSQDIYIGSSDTVQVPVFLTNFDQANIRMIRFSVSYDPNALSFVEALPAEQLNEPVNAELNGPDMVMVTLGGAEDIINSEWAELTQLTFLTTGMQADSSTLLSFTDIEVTSGAILPSASTEFNIIKAPQPNDNLSPSSIIKGDVNNDISVNMEDVQLAFENITGIGNQTEPVGTVLEVSGVHPTGVHDVAILYQHVVGLLPSLPNPKFPVSGQPDLIITDQADLQLSGPVQVTGDLYAYTITGANLEGLLSAELVIEMDTNVIEAVSAVQASAGPALINGMAADAGSYRISISSPSAIEDPVLDWITILALHKPDATANGLPSLISAVMNEGAIRRPGYGCTDANYLEYYENASTDDGTCITEVVEGCMDPNESGYNPYANVHDPDRCGSVVDIILPAPGFHNDNLVVNRTSIHFTNPEARANLFSLVDLNGRVMFITQVPPGTSITFPLSRLPAGNYFIRIKTGGRNLARPFIIVP